MAELSHVPRILVVEDDGLIALDIATTLQDAGAGEVTSLATVEAALRVMDETRFDAAILDLRLGPDGWSYDLAGRLRTMGVPFIFSSGTSEVSEDFRDVPLVMKPFSSEQLVAALVNVTAPRDLAAAG